MINLNLGNCSVTGREWIFNYSYWPNHSSVRTHPAAAQPLYTLEPISQCTPNIQHVTSALDVLHITQGYMLRRAVLASSSVRVWPAMAAKQVKS